MTITLITRRVLRGILRYISLILLATVFIFAKNIKYAKSDIHTLTLEKKNYELSLEYALLNDTVDIFGFKKRELKSIKKFGSIGDLDGYDLTFRYGITDKFMLNLSISTQNLQYIGDTLKNSRYDLFLRYHLYENDFLYFNSGLSFDIGYKRNSLKDFYFRDINAMNEMIKRVLPGSDAKLLYSDGIHKLDPNDPKARAKGYYAYFKHTYTKLNTPPYVSMIDTNDNTYYARFLTGFKNDNRIADFYIGYKKTKIKNTITTTQEILTLAKSKGYDLKKVLDRDESGLMFGFNYSFDTRHFVYEFNYEYDRYFRDSGLGYLNSNHIVKASISYILNRHWLLSLGGKIMFRQFNGEIPYLYSKYTQTTFDHKYGYSKFSITYSFK